jgi:hypothetical protein
MKDKLVYVGKGKKVRAIPGITNIEILKDEKISFEISDPE